MHKALCLVLWGMKGWLRGTLLCMFYSDNLVPLLVMFSGLALSSDTSASSVQTPGTLSTPLLPVALAALLPQALATFHTSCALATDSWPLWPCRGDRCVPSCLPGCFIFSPFLSCSFWFLPLLPLLNLTLFLICIDHFRWASLVWKNKHSNDLLPLCPLLFIPGNKDMLQELLPWSWG